MIVDVRRYTLKPGQLGSYLYNYGKDGYPVQKKHLGDALGWFINDVGPQNQVFHLWHFKDLADMEKRREKMASDPTWIEVRDRFKGIFEAQNTEIMKVIPNLPYTSSGSVPGLVDIRIYTLNHGELPNFIDFLSTRSSAIQARYWTDNIVYLMSHIGLQQTIMHIWGHADHSERLKRRGELLADPDWQDCMKIFLPMVSTMHTFTATPASFWSRPPEAINR